MVSVVDLGLAVGSDSDALVSRACAASQLDEMRRDRAEAWVALHELFHSAFDSRAGFLSIDTIFRKEHDHSINT